MARRDVTIRIGAEISEIKGALANVTQALDDLRRNGGKPIAPDTKKTEAGFNRLGGIVRKLGIAFTAIGAATAFVRLNDTARNLEARLKLVVDESENLAAVQGTLNRIATSTGQSLRETTDLYIRLGQAVKGTGTNAKALADVTQVVQQAVALSGASAESANAALIQLGQGLASGTLRGEELNSILEQTPVVADAIAAGMSDASKGITITRGDLRKMGEAGELTTEQIIKAFLKQKDAINEQAKTLPITFGKAFTNLGNAALATVATFEKVSGAGEGIAGTINRIALFLNSPQIQGAVAEIVTAWGEGIRMYVEDVRGVFRDFVGIVESGLGFFGVTLAEAGKATDGLVDKAIDFGKNFPIYFISAMRSVRARAFAFVQSVASAFQFLGEAVKAAFTDDTADEAFRRLLTRQAAINNAFDARQAEIQADEARALEAAKKARDERRKAAEAELTGDAVLGKFGNGKPTDKELKAAKELSERTLKIRQATIDRELTLNEQLFEDGKRQFADYVAEKLRLELEGIDAQIAAQRKLLADKDASGDALAEIEILTAKRVAAEQDAQRQITKAQIDAARERVDLEARLLEAQNKPGEAAALRLKAEFDELTRELEAKGDEAGLAIARQLFDTEKSKIQLDEIKRQADQFIADQRSRSDTIAAQADAGLVDGIEAERQIQAIRDETIAQLANYEAALKAAYAVSKDPTILDALREIQRETASATAAQRTFANTARNAGENALGDFFFDLASGAKSFGDAIKDAARQFTQALARMAAEALAKKAILALVGGGTGAGVFHAGGMVTASPATSRNISPLAFLGAPRYHSGGMVGLKPDEVPAILQTGEEVLSRNDPRNRANGGGGASGTGVRILNVIDPAMVGDYMTSASGEKTILNVIQRNRGSVKQLLG